MKPFTRLSVIALLAITATLLLPTTPVLASCNGPYPWTHVNSTQWYVSYIDTDYPTTSGGCIPLSSSLVFTTANQGTNVSGTTNNHATGMWYNGGNIRGGGWTVFNEDLANIPLQTGFNITYRSPYQGGSADAVYTHIATSSNSAGNYTLLDNPALNGNPNASVLINAAHISGHPVYDTHPLGIWYDALAQQWAIFHEDNTPIPNNAAYFVAANISAPSFLTVSSTTNNLFGKVIIDNPITNKTPGAVILVSQLYEGAANPHNVGVENLGGFWAIFNLDGSPIPPGLYFQVVSYF